MNETTVNEVQTAVDDPLKQQENINEDNPSTSGSNPDTTRKDWTEDSPTDDEEGEGEEQPLIRSANQSSAQPAANFVSLENMDHNGFLGTFMGACMVMDKGGEIMDDRVTLKDKGRASDVESGISEQECASVAESCEISEFFPANLDPFAAESEIFTSKLNSPATKNSQKLAEKTAAAEEGKYVSGAGFESRNIGNSVKPSPSSPYITAYSSVSSQRRGMGNGYEHSPTVSGTKPRGLSSLPTMGPQTSFSSGVVEFSKLDPFAPVSSEASIVGLESVSSNEARFPSRQPGNPGLPRQGNDATHSNLLGNEPSQDELILSSFLERDPMLELTINDGKQPSSIGYPRSNTAETLVTQKRSISPGGMNNASGYVSSYNSPGSNTFRAGETGAYYSGNGLGSFSPSVPNFSRNSGQAVRKQSDRSGYVSVKGSMGFHLAEKESANQYSSPKSRDELTKDMAFSNRDPFAVEAVGKQSTTSGQASAQKPRVSGPPAFSSASIRPTGITAFHKLFPESREAKSVGFSSAGLKCSAALGSTQGAAVTASTGNNPKPSSLTQLALKLSKSYPKENLQKHQSSEALVTTRSNSVQRPEKSKIVASSCPKKSGYVTVAKTPGDSRPLPRNPQTSVNFPSAANMDPFASKPGNFSGIKLYTEAESDKNLSRSSTPGGHLGSRLSPVQGYEKVARPVAEIRGSTGKSTNEQASLRSYPKPKYAPVGKRQSNSNSQTPFVSVSKSGQPNLVNAESGATFRDPNFLSKKPGAKMPEQEGDIHGTADIFQFSNTNIGDFLSNITSQVETELGGAKPPQQIEMEEIPSPQLSRDRKSSDSSGTGEEIGNNELHAGLVFDNIDPFAAPSRPDRDRKSPQKVNNGAPNISVNESREFNRTCELRSAATATGDASNPRSNVEQNSTVFVRSYSNAAKPESDEPQRGANLNPPQPKLPARNPARGSSQGGSLQGGSPPGGSPPGDSDGQNPPPLGRKPNASRKVSDLGNDYAKVTIQGAYEEPEIGAVGGGERGTELPEQVAPVQPATDGGEDIGDKTVVDPFNVQAAEESIQKLGLSLFCWPLVCVCVFVPLIIQFIYYLR